MADVSTPKTAGQLRDALLDNGKLKELIADDKLGDFLSDYEKHQQEVTEKQVEEAREKGLAEAYKSFRKGGGERLDMGEDESETAEWSNGQGRALGSWGSGDQWTKEQERHVNISRETTGGFKSPKEYYGRIAMEKMGIEPRGIDNARVKDLSINIGPDGGYLVPEVLRSQLLEVPLEMAVARPRAMVIPMDSLRVPIPTIDDTSHATSVFGGTIGYWTSENASITESQPAFGRVTLEAHKLAVYTEIPNELFQDSIVSVEALLNRIIPQAAAYFEDIAFLDGNGASRPQGVIDSSNNALVSVTRDTSSEVHWEDIVNMYARMLPSSIGSAVWVCSPAVFPQLATMALNVGTGGSAVWLSNGVSGAPNSILGRPLIITEKVPTLGTASDLSFIDFGQYIIGERQSAEMFMSPHFRMQNDQTAVRLTTRCDGQPWMRSAITPQNSGDTLSPYVTLAA